MNLRRGVIFVLVASMFSPNSAFSWGVRAHSVIDRVAIQTLPDDGPVFLKNYIDYIGGAASIPDTWRYASEPFSKIEEDPNHGWFREQFLFMKQPPRSRYEFVLGLYKERLRIEKTNPEQAKLMNVRWTGTLPYAAAEVYGHLVAAMRLQRQFHSQHKDTSVLEQTCAFYVAWMGHYIGDGAQPLHDTIHHDGWQGPNPKNYTQDHTIHGRFESQYVDAIQLSESDILPRIGKPGHLKEDVFDAVLAHLDEAGANVEKIYEMDKRNAFQDPKDKEAREMVYSRTAAGARMLRDLVYRAWKESENQPQAIPNPVSTANPLYNGDTGSAPAQRSQPIQ